MSDAVVFPGQGSQAVGMGRALADSFSEARHLFQEVDDALGQALSRLLWEGPAETLQLTENAQQQSVLGNKPAHNIPGYRYHD